MNCCFYAAIDRLPLGAVAAIEFIPVIVLAALGARTPRNAAALALAVPGVYLITGVRFATEPLGLALAFANAALFARLHRARRPPGQAAVDRGHRRARGRDARRRGGGDPGGRALGAPVARRPRGAGGGRRRGGQLVGDPVRVRPAGARAPPRATYALLVSLLPATATVVGLVVLAQVPTAAEAAGLGLVVAGVALHRDRALEDGAADQHEDDQHEHDAGHPQQHAEGGVLGAKRVVGPLLRSSSAIRIRGCRR